MYIYSVTVNISKEAHDEWLKWMKDVHIADVMKTGCFVDSHMYELLYVEDEGHTYSVQYRFLELADLDRYQKLHAPGLQAEHSGRFKDQFAAFRTVLKEVES
ncbi:MAG TPA: DUF4286 family protein [Bacteroidia bacterium]|nr:DUF4286 family protein [Bacteroidia bacterium]